MSLASPALHEKAYFGNDDRLASFGLQSEDDAKANRTSAQNEDAIAVFVRRCRNSLGMM